MFLLSVRFDNFISNLFNKKKKIDLRAWLIKRYKYSNHYCQLKLFIMFSFLFIPSDLKSLFFAACPGDFVKRKLSMKLS